MSKRNRQRKAIQNFRAAENFWLNRMLRLAYSSIEWKGLPDSVDTIYLERCLVRSGSAMIVFDDITDRAYSAQNASTGLLDIYGYPMERRAIFRNGLEYNATPENSVIIYANSMRASDIWIYEYFAARMANIDGAVDVNMNSQKTMPIIPTTQEQQLTIENLYEDVISNVPFALVEQNTVDVESFKNALVFDNRKSYTSDLMTATQREIWNRVLTFIGINNNNVDKKERTNVPEIDSNLEEIFFMKRDRLNARSRACEQMNELFGWDVEVDYYKQEVKQPYGNVYGGSQDNLRADVPESEPDYIT